MSRGFFEGSPQLRLWGRKICQCLHLKSYKVLKTVSFEGHLMKPQVCLSKYGRSSRALKLTPNNTGQHVEVFFFECCLSSAVDVFLAPAVRLKIQTKCTSLLYGLQNGRDQLEYIPLSVGKLEGHKC